jgi:hypothetical protein
MILGAPHCIYDILDPVFESNRFRTRDIDLRRFLHQQGRISRRLFARNPIEPYSQRIHYMCKHGKNTYPAFEAV